MSRALVTIALIATAVVYVALNQSSSALLNCAESVKGTCNVCKEGYKLTGSKDCVKEELPVLKAGRIGCLLFNANYECISCRSGFVLLEGECIPSGCMLPSAENSSVCLKCNDGFALNSNDQCISYVNLLRQAISNRFA